eukprot:540653_1
MQYNIMQPIVFVIALFIMNNVLCIENVSVDNIETISGFLAFNEQTQMRLLSRAHNIYVLQHNPVMDTLIEFNLFIQNMHNCTESAISKMKVIAKQYRLHPIFSSKLSFWIEYSWSRLRNDTDLFDVDDFEQIFDILNIHNIATSDLLHPPISKLNKKMQLLVLVSRGLVQYLAPTYSEELCINGDIPFHFVTWMSDAMDFTFVPFFCYLYKDLI